jgi:16S rRNA (cytosine967-C5)-methyltransferase
MLAHLASVVRPGGRLIYATCSSEPEENEQVVESFLAAHPEFRPATPLAFTDQPELAALLDRSGALKTLPFRDGLEAFYARALVKSATIEKSRT